MGSGHTQGEIDIYNSNLFMQTLRTSTTEPIQGWRNKDELGRMGGGAYVNPIRAFQDPNWPPPAAPNA